MRNGLMTILSMFLLVFAASGMAEDKVYRYTDANGVVHYTDKPPSKDAKPTKLPKLQTFGSAPPPSFDLSTAKAGPAPAAPEFSVAFDSPSPDQTYREPGSVVDVSVTVSPGLAEGFGILFYLDGVPLSDIPGPSTRFSVPGLERGSHSIEAAVVSPQGLEVARSSISVHMKPPTAKAKR